MKHSSPNKKKTKIESNYAALYSKILNKKPDLQREPIVEPPLSKPEVKHKQPRKIKDELKSVGQATKSKGKANDELIITNIRSIYSAKQKKISKQKQTPNDSNAANLLKLAKKKPIKNQSQIQQPQKETIKNIPKRTNDNIKYINELFKTVPKKEKFIPLEKIEGVASIAKIDLASKDDFQEKILTKRSFASSCIFKPFRNLSKERDKRKRERSCDNELGKLEEKFLKIYSNMSGEKDENSDSKNYESFESKISSSPKLINRIRSKKKLEDTCNKIKVEI